MEDLLQCPICYVNYDLNSQTPRQLPCQHNVCSRCLPLIQKSVPNQRGFIECPICREKFYREVNEIPKSLVIVQLIDAKRPGTSNSGGSSSSSSSSSSAAPVSGNGYNSRTAQAPSSYYPAAHSSPPPPYNPQPTYSYRPPSPKYRPPPPPPPPPQPSRNAQQWNFRDYLRGIFNEIDVNRDGSITASELQRALCRCQSTQFDMKTVELLISKYDTNMDREISFDEFFDLFNNLNQEYETFLLTDSDGSGFIDLHEFTEALKGKGYFFSRGFYEYIVNKICKRTKQHGIQFDIYIRVAARFDQLCAQYNHTLFFQKNSLENYLKENFFDDFW